MFVTVLLYGSLFALGYLFKKYFPKATWKLKFLYCLFTPLISIALVLSFFGLMIDTFGIGFGIGLLWVDVFVQVIGLSWTLWIVVYFTIRESKKDSNHGDDSDELQPDPKKYDDFLESLKQKKD